MQSIIKDKLMNLNMQEETIQISNIKPHNVPKKPNKNEFGENEISGINEVRESRLKAFNMMRNKKNNTNNMVQNNLEENSYNYINDVKTTNNRSNLSLINQFEQFYNDKMIPKEDYDSKNINNDNKFNNNKKNDNLYSMNLSYIFGINTQLNNQTICFHKKEKWVGYLNKNLIIIEDFSDEKIKNQNILKDSKNHLDVIKISENGKLIFSYSHTNPTIIFYNYNSEMEVKFKLINKIQIKHKMMKDCEISPQNNMAIVLSKFKL